MLTPRRALLHPAWLVALVVLGVNDHLLKGADILPGFVTGKLSDVAGLFVAPALLCVLVRVRSRSAMTAAHVATAVVFALVKTVPLATLAFERVLSLVTTSHVWTDPSDLVALPMVLLAHRVLAPVMEAEVSHEGWLSRLATVAGSVMCVATSAPSLPALSVHNGSSRTLQVTIRSTSAKFESEVIHSKTPLPLNAALFDGLPTSFAVKPNEKATPPTTLPDLALVLVDDASANVHKRFAVASRSLRNLEIGELPGGEFTLSSPDDAIDVRDLDKSAACAAAPFAKTYTMSIPDAPYGQYTITSSKPVDGCIVLGFKETTTQGKVCLPEGVWSFQVGDELFGNFSQIAHDRDGVRTVVMVETRKSSTPLVADETCARVDACNTIAFAAQLPLGDGTLLSSGEEHTYTRGEETLRTIAGALTHTVLEMTCASDELGDHANYVIVSTVPVPPPLDGGVDASPDGSSDAGTD